MTIEELDAKMSAEFAAVRAHVDARITAESETTRRHFDIVAEQIKDHTKVLGIGRHTERLDDHEKRISTIESRSS